MSDRKRWGESGNVFFTLFGAVALVGVIGAATATLMRGPVGTMVALNEKAKVDSQEQIAGKLAMLEAAQQANSGDCDSDGFVEPIPPDLTCANHPTGGGCIPAAIGSAKTDPWGTTYGYCAWNHGTVTSGGTCSADLLTGTAASDKAVIAIVSAGPDRTFQTTCAADPAYLTTASGSDDFVLSYTYAEAVQASGGLWTLKSGAPGTATIDKNIDVSGTAHFQSGITGDTTFGGGNFSFNNASGLYLPDTSALACTPSSTGTLGTGLITGLQTVQICDPSAPAGPHNHSGWVDVGGAAAGTGVAGSDKEIQFNDAGVFGASSTLTWDKTAGMLTAAKLTTTSDASVGGNLAVTGTGTITGAFEAKSTGTFDNTVDVTGKLTAKDDLQVDKDANVTGNIEVHNNSLLDGTLGVAGLSTLTGGAVTKNGSAAAPGLAFLGSSSTGIYFTSGSGFGISVGGLPRGVFSSSGLAVSGDSTATGDVVATGGVAGADVVVGAIGSGVGLFSDGAAGLQLRTANVSRFAIDAAGDIGVHLAGTPTTAFDLAGLMRLRDTGMVGGGMCGAIGGAITYTSSDTLLVCSSLTGKWETIGTSGGGGGGATNYWTKLGDSRLYYILNDVGIGTNDPKAKLHVAGGSFLTEGTYTGTAVAPVSGAGTRMFFDPASGAFRAGGASGTEWDSGSIGVYSAALGGGNQALGAGAMAFGGGLYSNAYRSIAMGSQASALASNSFALGLGNAGGVSPKVTGANSFGIFMGDQSSVNLSDSNIMGLFGGKLVVDPNVPATMLTTNNSLAVDVNGDVGAVNYCDEAGLNCFTATDITGGATGAPGNDREILFNSGGKIGTYSNFVFTSAGRLGVANGTPQAMVDIAGFTRVADGDATTLASGSGLNLTYNTGTPMGNIFAHNYTANTPIDITLQKTGGTTWIGTSSTTQDSALVVYGKYTGYSNNHGIVNIYTSDNQGSGIGPSIIMGGKDGSGSVNRAFAAIAGRKENGTSGNYAGYLSFATRPNGSNLTEQMRITSLGKVGIGLTGPATLLDINGTIRFAYGGETCSASTLGGLYYSSATHLMYGCLTSGSWTQIGSAGAVAAAGSNTQVQFNSGGYLGASSNFVWDNTNGRLGIGITSPTRSLEIYQNTNADVFTYIHNGYAGKGAWLDIAMNGNNGGINIYGTGQAWSMREDGTTSFVIKDATNSKIPFQIDAAAPTNSWRLTAAGIGVGLTAPATRLDVNGSIRFAYGGESCAAGTLGAMYFSSATHLLYGCLTAGSWTAISTGSTAGAAAGSNTQVQYNSGGALAGSSTFTWTNSTSKLGLNGATIWFNSTNNTLGYQALNSLTSGAYNTGLGFSVLSATNTGSFNSAFGYTALMANTSGTSNVASGAYGLRYNTTGNYNTATGVNALRSNTGGSNNTANGVATLQGNTSGTYNTANGVKALYSSTTANYNTADGSFAFASSTTGYQNTGLGYAAGFGDGSQANNRSLTDYNMVFLGMYAGRDSSISNATTLNNGIAIGYGATVYANNQAVLGAPSITKTILRGATSVGYLDGTAAATKLDINGSIRFAYSGESCSASTLGGLYYSSATHLMYGCLTAGSWTQIGSAGAVAAAGSNTQVQFNSGGYLGASSNFVWDNTNGWLGLGITPSSLLHMRQDFAGTTELKIENQDASGYAALGFYGTGNVNRGKIFTADNAGGMYFRPGAATTYDMYLNSTGKLGIGNVPAPATQLDVNGTIRFAYGGESCDASHLGGMYFSSATHLMYGCLTAGSWTAISTGATAGAAAGSTTQIQYNSAGSLAGSSSFTYDDTAAHISLVGSLSITGDDAGLYHDITTPAGATVSTRLGIGPSTVGAFDQLEVLGLTAASDVTARGLMILDARASGSHQPSLAVLSPDEANMIGFSWEGVNNTAYLKTTNSIPMVFSVGGLDRLTIEGNFSTPGSTSVPAIVTVPVYSLAQFGHAFVTGLASGSNASATGVSVFDARAGAHWPSIAAWSLDEANLAGFSWEGGSTTAYLKTTAGNWGFISGNTNLMRLLSTGEVGVGLTSPAVKLDVNGTIRFGYSGESCDASHLGGMYFSSATHLMYGCLTSGSWTQIGSAGAVTAAGSNTQVQFNSGGNLGANANFVWDNTNGRLGIGTASPSHTLDVALNQTRSSAGYYIGATSVTTVAPTANQASGTSNWGFMGQSNTDVSNTKTVDSMIGVLGQVLNNGSGAVDTTIGLSGFVKNYSNITGQATGGYLQAYQEANTAAVLIGADIQTQTENGGGATTVYGLRVTNNQWTGSTATRYGVYLASPNGSATNDWGFYQAGTQKNYLAGRLGLGQASPATPLDVNGTIRFGYSGEGCSASTLGGMYYSSATHLIYGCLTSGSWTQIGSAGAVTAAGSNSQVQFNSGGNLGASSNFVWTNATQVLSVTGNVTATNASSGGTGIAGVANTGAGVGVSGSTSSTTANAFGVSGNASGTSGAISGVYGTTASASGYGMWGVNTASGGVGVVGQADTGAGIGVMGTTNGTASASGVRGKAIASTGATYGVSGYNHSSTGYAGHFSNDAASGVSYGIFAQTASPTGYVIYSSGTKNYFSGLVGVGQTSPATKLDVNGTIRFAYGGETCSASTLGGMYYSSATHLVYACLTAGSWTQLASGASGATLGTSVTTANPSIASDTTSGFYTTGGTSVSVANGGVQTIQFNKTNSAVNYLTVAGGAAGAGPTIGAAGTDTNININMTPKGTGAVAVTGQITTTDSVGITGQAVTTVVTPSSTISAGSITAAMLKAVNSPTDEYCLTYETTVGDFEWQACGASTTIGTSATTANPSIAGDTTSGLFTGGGTSISVANGGVRTVQFNTTASGVNYFTMASGATGGTPTLSNGGSDTNGAGLGLSLTGKSATAAGNGGAINLTGGAGFTAGTGGGINLLGGTGGGTSSSGAGGAIAITGGTGGATNNAGGAVSMTGGTAAGTGTGGALSLNGGAASATAGSIGGGVGITAAAGSSTGTGAAGGAVTITAGSAGGSGANNGGDVTITTGAKTGAGTNGSLFVKVGATTFLTVQNPGTASSSMIMAGTSALTLPRGLTSERPSSPVNGMIRYNSTDGDFDIYANSAWKKIVMGTTSAATSAAGSTKQIQFNSGGALGANANFVWDNTNGRLGVGTASPTVPLDVTGAIKTSDSVSIAGQSVTTLVSPTIPSGSITASMLKAVNSPTDEYCLTYETTVGDFEWQTCGGASNLGTSTSAANPAISGDATSGFFTPAASTVSVAAGGKEVMRWNTAASAVNYLAGTPSATGAGPKLESVGSDTNVDFTLGSKGTGSIGFSTNGSTRLQMQVLDSGGAQSNYLTVKGAATGNAVTIGAGGDANTGINILGKGTGAIGLGTASGTMLKVSDTASAVNYLNVTGGASSTGPTLSALGTGTNLNINLTPKGTGAVAVTGPISTTDRVSISGQAVTTVVSPAATIAGGSITAAMLKAVNSPTDEYCLTYESTVGDFEWQSCGGTTLNGITAATANQTGIANGAYTIAWNWDTLAGGSALKLASTSTAAASNAQKMFEIALSGTNSTSAQSTYGAYISNSHAGTTSTNYGLYVSASGGTAQNYAVYGATSGTVNGDAAVYGNSTGASGSVYGVYGASASASGFGVYGTSSATAGVAVKGIANTGAATGVVGGTSSTTNGASGVYGTSTGASGTVYGVYGDSASASGFGVYGTNSATAGVGIQGVSNTGAATGVLGTTSSTTTNAAGVKGTATGTTGQNYGVIGTTVSTTSYSTGVYGVANGTSGIVYGVEGNTFSTSTDAIGTKGYARGTSGRTYGVFGQTDSITTGTTGVKGVANGATGATYGVQGTNASTTTGAAGVYGYASGASGTVYGVYGYTANASGNAGFFSNDGSGGVGLSGEANYGAGVGVRGNTVSTTAGATGVKGMATGASGATYGVYGSSASSTGYGGYFTNASTGVALYVSGDIQYTGTLTDVSDRRLKNDLVPLSRRGSMLDRIGQIRTYSFTMKADPKKQTEFGVVAQEMRDVFPELVKEDHSANHYLSVNYVGLIAPLIEATKELKAENDNLKDQVGKMKAQQADVMAQLEDLKTDVKGLKGYTGYGTNKAEMGVGMLIGMMLMAGFGGFVFIVARRRNPS